MNIEYIGRRVTQNVLNEFLIWFQNDSRTESENSASAWIGICYPKHRQSERCERWRV